MQFGWSRRRKMQASRVHYWQCLHTVSKLRQGNFQNPTCKPTSHGTGVQSESWKSYPRSLDVVQSGLKPVLKESRDLSFLRLKRPRSYLVVFPELFSGVQNGRFLRGTKRGVAETSNSADRLRFRAESGRLVSGS